MNNSKTLKGITVADLLLQIQDAQNKIQAAQAQIAESLEAIKALQAQEPEIQETQQVEEIRPIEEKPQEKETAPDRYEEYSRRIEKHEREGYEALSALDGLPEKLERLENECFAFGCPVDYDEGILADSIRRAHSDFQKGICRMEQDALEGEFERLEEFLKMYEAEKGGWRHILGIDEKLEWAKRRIENWESALNEIKEKYDERGKSYPPITDMVGRLRRLKE